jgi:hypothetical protein
VKKFKRTFSFPNWDIREAHSYYTWDDPAYSKFMTDILKKLEPRQEDSDIILFNELEEINEIIFF